MCKVKGVTAGKNSNLFHHNIRDRRKYGMARGIDVTMLFCLFWFLNKCYPINVTRTSDISKRCMTKREKNIERNTIT